MYINKTIAEVCNFFNDGNWIESKDQSLNGIRLIQTGNIGKGFFKNKEKNKRYISADTFTRLKCSEIFEGDILVSRLPDPIGRSCKIPASNERMITAVDCSIIRLNNSVNPDFFLFFSQSNQYFKQIEDNITGTTRSRISRSNLGKILFPVPSLSEQQAIVEKLEFAFDAIEKAKANIEKNIENAKELFQSKLNAIFSQKGEGWEEKKLSEVFKMKSGVNLTSKMMKPDGEFPVFGGNNIAGYYDDYNFESGVIVGRVGALCGNVRFIDRKIWITDNAFKLTDFRFDLDFQFLTYLLNFKNLREYARQTAQPVISNSSLKDVILSFPKSTTEQQKIVTQLNLLSDQTNLLQEKYKNKLANLDELKRSILEKAFKGELV